MSNALANALLNGAYFISGPAKSSAIVYDKDAIDPAIKMLGELHGYESDDYTVTDLSQIWSGEVIGS